jgi:two-component system nitrogen regulation response regulator GlnG
VISATNRDLRRHVIQGEFRQDLYHRLMTFSIEIPPLRERPEDIADLVEYFLNEWSASGQNQPASPPKADQPLDPGPWRSALSAAVMTELMRRPWHGNVRELRNVLEHAAILARGGEISVEHLPPPAPRGASLASEAEALAAFVQAWTQTQLQAAGNSGDLYERFLSVVEPPLLGTTLNKYRGQCASAARALGLHRTTLRKKLDQYGLGEA